MATVAVPDDAAAPPTFAEAQRPRAALGPGERTVFLIGVGVIALHVADDSFLQRSPARRQAITSSAASCPWPP
jgi:hypothetical protein